MSIRTSWQQIVAVQIYLDHGIGAAPWIAFGDWNVEPIDLDTWMEKLVAVQVPPENVAITSFGGEGRLYDFA
eukprot:8447346-Pyramimonas_sp.AAC.1